MATKKKPTVKYQAHVSTVVHVYVPLKATTLLEAADEAKDLKWPQLTAALTADADTNLIDYDNWRVLGVSAQDWD